MNRCKRCNINIYDDTIKCPLCNGVVYNDELINEVENSDEVEAIEERESHSLMYPSLSQKIRKMQLAVKIVIFSSVVAELVCILVNCLTFRGFWWSFIVGVDLIYACFTVIYASQRNTGHRNKLLILALGAGILAVALDYIIGFRGWSFDYFIPGTVVLLTITIIVLMAATENWQNYIFMQIILVIFSVLYLIFIPLGFVDFEFPSIVAVAVTCLTLLWLVLFGDRAAHNEIKRRFHI